MSPQPIVFNSETVAELLEAIAFFFFKDQDADATQTSLLLTKVLNNPYYPAQTEAGLADNNMVEWVVTTAVETTLRLRGLGAIVPGVEYTFTVDTHQKFFIIIPRAA